MERNELIWSLMVIKKGQEDVDITLVACSKKRSLSNFLAR